MLRTRFRSAAAPAHRDRCGPRIRRAVYHVGRLLDFWAHHRPAQALQLLPRLRLSRSGRFDQSCSARSTQEIDQSAEELNGILHEIELGLDEMKMISDMGERQSKAKGLSEKMTRARNMQHSMKVELQDLDDRERKVYDQKVKDFNPRITSLQDEIKKAKNNSMKADLVAGASPTSRDPSQVRISMQHLLAYDVCSRPGSRGAAVRSSLLLRTAVRELCFR